MEEADAVVVTPDVIPVEAWKLVAVSSRVAELRVAVTAVLTATTTWLRKGKCTTQPADSLALPTEMTRTATVTPSLNMKTRWSRPESLFPMIDELAVGPR